MQFIAIRRRPSPRKFNFGRLQAYTVKNKYLNNSFNLVSGRTQIMISRFLHPSGQIVVDCLCNWHADQMFIRLRRIGRRNRLTEMMFLKKVDTGLIFPLLLIRQ